MTAGRTAQTAFAIPVVLMADDGADRWLCRLLGVEVAACGPLALGLVLKESGLFEGIGNADRSSLRFQRLCLNGR